MTKAREASALCCSLMLAGCATISSHTTTSTEPSSSTRTTTTRSDPDLTVDITLDDAGFSVSARHATTCETFDERLFRDHERTIRRAKRLWLEYVVAVAAAGAGIAVALDAPNVPTADDPTTMNPVGRSGAYAIGIGMSAFGVFELGSSISHTLRARDSDRMVKQSWQRDGDVESSECESTGVANTEVWISTSGHPGATFPLGITDAQGSLRVAWGDLPPDLLEGASFVATASIGMGKPTDGTMIGSIDLSGPHAAAAEVAWQQVRDATSSDPVAAFRQRFPESHADEAQAKLLSLQAHELARTAREALQSGRVDDAVAAIETCVGLNTSVDECRALQGAVDDARADELARKAKTALRDKDYGTAIESATSCQALRKDRADCARIAKSARAAQTKALLAAAKRAFRAKQFDDAISALDECLANEPDAHPCLILRDKVVARLEKDAAKARARGPVVTLSNLAIRLDADNGHFDLTLAFDATFQRVPASDSRFFVAARCAVGSRNRIDTGFVITSLEDVQAGDTKRMSALLYNLVGDNPLPGIPSQCGFTVKQGDVLGNHQKEIANYCAAGDPTMVYDDEGSHLTWQPKITAGSCP